MRESKRARVWVSVAAGVAEGILAVVAAEVRAGNALCLLGRHDWWVCRVDTPGHDHRHCRRCGAQR